MTAGMIVSYFSNIHDVAKASIQMCAATRQHMLPLPIHTLQHIDNVIIYQVRD